MVDYTLCLNDKCIYQKTCWRSIWSQSHEDGDEYQSVAFFEWPKDECYIPEDGKKL